MVLLRIVSGTPISNLPISSSHCDLHLMWPWPWLKVSFICMMMKTLSHTIYDQSVIILQWIAYEKWGKVHFFHIFKVTMWPWQWVKVVFQYTIRKVLSHTTFDQSFITVLLIVYKKWGEVHFFTFSRSPCDLDLGSRSYSNTPLERSYDILPLTKVS